MSPRAALLAAAAASACAHGGTRAPEPSPTPPPPPQPATAPERCPASWWVRAEARADQDPSGAARSLRRCLGERDAPASAFRLLASLEVELDRPERARRTLLQAVVRHREDAYAWAALARLEAEAGRPEVALGAMERAHRLRPRDRGLAHRYQRLLRDHGRPEQRRAARLAPLLAESEGRAEMGDVEGALEVLKLAADLAADSRTLRARVQVRVGLLHLRREAYAEAEAACRAGLERLGDGEDVPRLRAELQLLRSELALVGGRPEEALAAADRALQWVPAHPLAVVNRALARLELGDHAGAVEDLSTALSGGLARRMTREAFLGLDGVAELLGASPPLRQAFDAAWIEPGADP